ncbi:MAG: hypothetical protein R3C53_08015 [Pirellulaceae bacterium]
MNPQRIAQPLALTFMVLVGTTMACQIWADQPEPQPVRLSLTDSVSGVGLGVESDDACLEPNACDSLGIACADLAPTCFSCLPNRRRIPAMVGDFFGGAPFSARADSVIDRLLIVANDLDTPQIMPAGSSRLTLSEPGPIGAFDTSLASVQQLQTLLRSGSPLPGVSLAGTLPDAATLTTLNTIAQIQSQLASTGVAFDIIALQNPPAGYSSGLAALFAGRNGSPGLVSYDAAASGAILQSGADTFNGGEDLDAYYFFDYILRYDTALADAASGGMGRLKIAEGGAVLPTDRVFFRHNSVNGIAYSAGGQSLTRFVPGFEKTMLDGLASFELRVPFSANAPINSAFASDGSIATGDESRFGNLTMYAKLLLIDRQRFALSGGLGIAAPTGDDVSVNLADGTRLLHIGNQSVHLQPFLGMLYTPNNDWFAHGFLQTDFATNGSTVTANTGSGMTNVGTFTDPNFLYADFGIGWWVFQSQRRSGLTGVIPTVEVHHTNSLGAADVITAGPIQVGNFRGSVSQTSLVAGTTLEFGTRTQLTAGYAVPLTPTERQYNNALNIQFSRSLGR